MYLSALPGALNRATMRSMMKSIGVESNWGALSDSLCAARIGNEQRYDQRDDIWRQQIQQRPALGTESSPLIKPDVTVPSIRDTRSSDCGRCRRAGGRSFDAEPDRLASAFRPPFLSFRRLGLQGRGLSITYEHYSRINPHIPHKSTERSNTS
jgi:hypothetical protein